MMRQSIKLMKFAPYLPYPANANHQSLGQEPYHWRDHRRATKKTSEAWQCFNEGIIKQTGQLVVRCKGCQKPEPARHPATVAKSAPTTGLLSHRRDCLQLKQMYSQADVDETRVHPAFSSVGVKSVTSRKPTVDQVNEEVLKFIISGNISFNQAENPHFQKLLKWIATLSGETITTNRKKVRKQLEDEAVVANVDLHELFKQVESKISLALDNWTSRNGFAFMGMFSFLYECNVQFKPMPLGLD